MKIGILTYHRVVNDGSVMQAFCLSNILKAKFPESSVEIIDYRPSKLERLERRRFISKTPPFIKWNYIKKKKQCFNFLKQHVSISKENITSDNLGLSLKFLEKQNYDLIFVGSDTAWEYKKDGNVPPPPNLYYLPNKSSYKKISFAISSDPIGLETITPNKREELYDAINGFDFISVRDAATKEYLLKLGINRDDISYSPDPTIIFDFQSILEINKITRLSESIGVSISNKKIRQEIMQSLQSKGVSIIDFNDPKIGSLLGKNNTVLGRLGAHASLKGLITDRFHGSIFAMKIGAVPTVFVEHAAKWPLENSKGRDLFTRLELDHMIHRWKENEENDCLSYLEKWRKNPPTIEKSFKHLASMFKDFENKLDLING